MEKPQRTILLASKSPRRQELLGKLGYSFEVWVKDIDENVGPYPTPAETVLAIAEKKARAYSLSDKDILITADTIVTLDGKILGKPVDFEDAFQMIQSLSGRSHKVISAVCIKSHRNEISFYEETIVHFKPLLISEIESYIHNFKPYDKAGAYGIQEWIGMIGIEKIEGCFYNVMGLPTRQLNIELQKFIQNDL